MSTSSSPTGSSPADSKERVAPHVPTRPNVDLEQIGEKEGYVLDEENLRRALNIRDHTGIKTASDGKTVLIPQPSEDPQDPLNWPTWKKTVILYIVALTAFTGDYGSAIGGITLLPQAKYIVLSLRPVSFPDYFLQRMAYGARSYQSRHGWECLHAGSRRHHRCLVLCIFWTTSRARFLPVTQPRYISVERLSDQL